MTGRVFNIQRFSVNDGPGIRTTVFLKGCPLHCAWCHNPESISPEKEVILRPDRCIHCGACLAACKNQAVTEEGGVYSVLREQCLQCGDCVEACVAEARNIASRDMMTEEVMAEILKDRVYYEQSSGGVTFSGGEPLMQHEFLLSMLALCRAEGIHTAVDTSGLTSPSILERVSEFTDLFLYDIKTMDDGRHREFTGVSNRQILENLRLLDVWNKKVIIRVPVIPGINMDMVSIGRIGAFVASLQNIHEINLLPYHKTGIDKYNRIDSAYSLRSTVPPTADELSHIVETLEPCGAAIAIGG